MTLVGKTALVTGSCGGGMGRSTALCLARDGANIVLNYGTYRRGDAMRAAAEQIAAAVEDLGGHALIQQADTKDERQVVALVAAASRKFGGIDILVCNAGGPFNVRDLTEIPFDDWRDVLAAEIDGPFLLMKHLVPGMRQRGWGRIIFIGADVALRVPNGSAPDYFLGKAARGWMTLALAPREESRGIAINCMEPHVTAHLTFEDAVRLAKGAPGTTHVTLHDPGSGKELWQGAWQDRPGPACHDVAEAIAVLCSEKGRFISGELIRLPGFPGA